MKLDAHNQNNAFSQIRYKNMLKQEEINIKFFGVGIDKHMIWKMQINLLVPELFF